MNKPKFIMMCGLVASGKSFKAAELAKEYNATIFSSDELREEMFGDVNCQEHNQELFVELHRRIKDCLQSGNSAIMDATNLNYKKRMSFLAELKNIPCEKICFFVATPYEECLRRNANRDRKVPEHVIKRMYYSIDIPWYYEGWDNIEVEYADGSEKSFGWAFDWVESVMDYNQDNPHHTLTLGQHCKQAKKWIDNNLGTTQLRYAALLHDCGKTKTKTFVNSKGETTNVAHYYSHERTGSYDSLFYEIPTYNLYVAVIIRWHMQPYFWEKDNNDKLRNKYRKLWGEDLYKDILKLHEADKFSH
jgi:predicted kinase